MDEKMIPEEHIFEEMRRRTNLGAAIDSTIQLLIEPLTERYLKRGQIQKLIFEYLKLSRTPELCRFINERMAGAGYTSCIHNGNLSYRNF